MEFLPGNHNKRIQKFELYLGLLVTAVLLLYQFRFMQSAGGLWRDEISSLTVATQPSLGKVWQSLPWHPIPLAPHMALRSWSFLFGSSMESLRMYGFLVGVSLVATLWFCSRLLGRSVPLLALALLMLNPLTIQISASVRPFGLSIISSLLVLALVGRWLENPSRKIVFATMFAAILSVQCSFQNAFVLMGILTAGSIVSLYKGDKKTTGALILAGIMAAASILPYLPVIRKAQDWSMLVKGPVPFTSLLKIFSQALGAGGTLMITIWLGLSLLALLIVIHRNRWRCKACEVTTSKTMNLYYGLVLLIMTGLYLVFLKRLKVPTQPWYYLSVMAPAALCLDMILRSTPKRNQLRILLVGFILIATGKPTWDKIHFRQTNLDLITEKLEPLAGENDLILLTQWYYNIGFYYYYEGDTACLTIPPVPDGQGMHRYDLIKQQMISQQTYSRVRDTIADTLRTGHKIWLVGELQPPDRNRAAKIVFPLSEEQINRHSYARFIAQEHELMGAFLQNHAEKCTEFPPVTKQNVNPYENVRLLLYEGWIPEKESQQK
jgi:hypothetical protein